MLALRQAGRRAGRRVDGDGADRAAAEGALAAHAPPLPVLRRRRGRRGGDPARDGARGEPGLPRRRRSARRPERTRRRCRSSSTRKRSSAPFRTRCTASSSPSTARRAARRRSSRRARCSPGFDQNTRWLDAVRHVAGRLDLPEEVVRTLPRAVTPGAAAPVQRAFEPGLRLEREALAGCAFHPELKPMLAELSPEHFENPDLRELRARVARGDERRGSGGQRAARAGRGDRARRRRDQDRPPAPARAEPAQAGRPLGPLRGARAARPAAAHPRGDRRARLSTETRPRAATMPPLVPR